MEDVKTKIVDAFIRHFNEKGVKVTLDEICADIHISKKTIYNYFTGKDDIYRYILRDSAEYIKARQNEIADDPNLSVLEKVKSILTISTKYDNRVDFAKISALSTSSPDVFKAIEIAYSDQWDTVRRVLNQAKEDGTFRKDVNIELLIVTIRQCLVSFYDRGVLSRMELSYSDALRALVDLILEGALEK